MPRSNQVSNSTISRRSNRVTSTSQPNSRKSTTKTTKELGSDPEPLTNLKRSTTRHQPIEPETKTTNTRTRKRTCSSRNDSEASTKKLKSDNKHHSIVNEPIDNDTLPTRKSTKTRHEIDSEISTRSTRHSSTKSRSSRSTKVKKEEDIEQELEEGMKDEDGEKVGKVEQIVNGAKEITNAEEEEEDAAPEETNVEDDEDDRKEEEEEEEEAVDKIDEPAVVNEDQARVSEQPEPDQTQNREENNSTPVIDQTTPPPPPTVPRPPPLTPMKMSLETMVRAGEPRLVIHQIVLNNFKSYAGRQVIGPFHKSFSAIVGPNGSGKSNTIDALLFVFGFKATKMRQGKLSELIHNSSASPKGGFEYCSVEVWFRNIIDQNGPDDYTVVPNSSLIVARTATRANQSKYTINGKLSNFTEVTSLLKAKGIDLDHKRFLILQGEVESIAQMKPKSITEHDEGLLEYLEDIIGTNRFRNPIENTLKELENYNLIRSQKLERVKLVEREINLLKSRKLIADEYLNKMNLLIQSQNLLWQYYIWFSKKNLNDSNNTILNLEERLEENLKNHESDIKEKEILEKEFFEKEKDYKDVESETNEFIKALERKEQEMVQVTEKLKHSRGKLKKLKKSISEDEHAFNAANSTIKDSNSEIEKLRSELEIKEASIEKEEAELDRIRDSLKDKTQVFADQIEEKQAELAPWAAQVTSKKAALELAKSERDLLVKKTADVEAALLAAEETVKRIESESGSKSDELKTLKKEQKEYQQGIRDAQAELQKMDQEDAKLRKVVNQARQKAEEAKIARSKSSSKGQVLNSLTKLKQQGRLRGFHGRLGDLGRIDGRYDIAISTACPQLDNLVCDSVETGQKCLSHLKQTNAGRAVILCLDALAKVDDGSIETPERAPRLIDLVTPKEESFKPAFYHVLRDTVVAEDLAQANRIAFGGKRRWRVVTLDGKLIDSSGTMSGGGNRVARGLMGASMVNEEEEEYSEEVVAKLEKESSKAEERLAKHMNERAGVEEELCRLQNALPKVEMKITKLEMDLSGGIKRLEEAKRTIADIRAQDNSDSDDTAQIEELESQMEIIEGEMDKLKRKTSKIEESIKTLQEKILEVGGVQLRTQQSKVKDLKAAIEHSSSRLTKAEVAITKAERDLEKYKKQIKKNNEEIELVSIGLEELENRSTSINSETDLMRDTVENARIQLEDQREILKDIQERRNKKLKVMNKFDAEQTKLGQEKEIAEAARTKAENLVDHWSRKQASLKLNVIDNDDDDDDDDDEKMEVKKKNEEVLKQYPDEEFENFDVEMTKAEVAKLEATYLEETTKLRDQSKQLLEDLNQQRLEEFMWGFQIISGKLKEMYQMITLGGNAELELVDSLDPFSEGIIFSVMPPKKSWKNISNLSGGEKTLSSLALVFALHAFKPTPLYFMDEIDAALDFRNVSIIGNYIKDRVDKTKNCTKSIAVDNSELGVKETSTVTS
ncbi:hypothetical protein CROQUDRAFT_655607 [Cronartium quercuum f. sp. fusiforme G11]|uniref:SMC hinge domain-containing protein n=1 Tax=Cronartium quercuum f. sp. fusiforme G11 TaxID=708437 RepID=A0A9P6NPB9_9BASI|nr:hypothetical protein CROQUDRAFT_655607 [Cronartium quercuum f. sp. fusiforme G11]